MLLSRVFCAHPVSFVSQILNSTGDAVASFCLAPLILMLYGSNPVGATVYGCANGLGALTQYCALPLLGLLSQHKGRRFALVFSSLGTLSYLCMLCFVVHPKAIVLMFVALMVRGGTAGMTTTNVAVAADVYPPGSERATFIAIITAGAWALAFLLAAPIAFLLVGEVPFPVLFGIGACLSLSAVLLIAFRSKESLCEANRVPWSWRLLNPLHALRIWTTRPVLNLMYSSYFMFGICVAFAKTFVFFYGHYRFGLSYKTFVPIIGLFAVSMILFFLISGIVMKRIGGSATYVIGLTFGVVASIGMGMARNLVMYIVFFFVATPCAMCAPAFMSMIAALVGPKEQSQMQSFGTGVILLASFLSETSFGFMLSTTVEDNNVALSSLCFWCCAFFFALGIFLFFFSVHKKRVLGLTTTSATAAAAGEKTEPAVDAAISVVICEPESSKAVDCWTKAKTDLHDHRRPTETESPRASASAYEYICPESMTPNSPLCPDQAWGSESLPASPSQATSERLHHSILDEILHCDPTGTIVVVDQEIIVSDASMYAAEDIGVSDDLESSSSSDGFSDNDDSSSSSRSANSPPVHSKI
eukprot:ANDGO_08401.mRNA.1 hypothetical protein